MFGCFVLIIKNWSFYFQKLGLTAKKLSLFPKSHLVEGNIPSLQYQDFTNLASWHIQKKIYMRESYFCCMVESLIN